MSPPEFRRGSDAPALLSAFERGELIRPDFDAPNLVDLSTSILHWAGAPLPRMSANARRMRQAISGAERLLFVVVDGMGMSFIRSLPESAFLRRNVSMEMQSVFPSTTSAAFTSLATASWPNQHGIIGWDMFLDEINAVSTIIRFERRRDGMRLDRLGVGGRQAYPLPSLFARMRGSLTLVVPEGIARTPFSVYWSGHAAAYVPYRKLSRGVDEAASRIRAAKTGDIVHFYTAALDYEAHEHGTDAPQTASALRSIDAEIERLAYRLPSGARLVITADHGQLNSRARALRSGDTLLRHLDKEPWGDAREMHFSVRADSVEVFEREFRERFGDEAFLLTADEVERLELFGPGKFGPLARRRVGGHIALSRGASSLLYQPSDKASNFLGAHSGLSPNEMLVPLIIV